LLFELAFAFDDPNVAIDWQVREAFDFPAWPRPFHFEPVDLRRRADREDLSRIV
jgi:hypothetical protein